MTMIFDQTIGSFKIESFFIMIHSWQIAIYGLKEGAIFRWKKQPVQYNAPEDCSVKLLSRSSYLSVNPLIYLSVKKF